LGDEQVAKKGTRLNEFEFILVRGSLIATAW
jgi:hypothetical protein